MTRDPITLSEEEELLVAHALLLAYFPRETVLAAAQLIQRIRGETAPTETDGA